MLLKNSLGLNVVYAKANRSRKNLNDFLHELISLVDGPATNWALALAERDNDIKFFRRVMAVLSGYWPDLSQESSDRFEVNEVETGLEDLACDGTVAPAEDKIVRATNFIFFIENYGSVMSNVRSQSSISEELS